MATVLRVEEVRKPQLNPVTKAGSRMFHVYFNEYIIDKNDHSLTDKYSTFIYMAAVAVDPNTGLSVPNARTNFDGDVPSGNQPTCVSIDVELYDDQNLIWEVTCRFEAPTEQSSDGDGAVRSDFPWNESPSVVWGNSTIQQPISVDLAGNAIVNSAGQRFDETVTRPVAIQTVTCTFNTKSSGFTPSKSSELVNTVNSSGFNIFGTGVSAGTALLKTYGGAKLVANVNGTNVNYWQVTAAWDILSNAGDVGWQGIILDSGTQEFKNNGLHKIKSDEGPAFTSPQLLNGSGQRLIKAHKGGINGAGSNQSNLETKKIGNLYFMLFKQYKLAGHQGIV